MQPSIFFGSEPEVTSIFPLGGQRGTTVKVIVTGKFLRNIHSVWFNQKGIQAYVKKIKDHQQENRTNSKKTFDKIHQAHLEMKIKSSAQLGLWILRLVSPQGISEPLIFRVHNIPSLTEIQSDTNSKPNLISFPSMINGKISQPGERDIYAIDVKKNQHLFFELISKPSNSSGVMSGFESVLSLYTRPHINWFGSNRSARLTFDNPFLPNPRKNPQFSYRFSQSGQYLLEVGSLRNLGAANYGYQLQITESNSKEPIKSPETITNQSRDRWEKRIFSRQINHNYISQILGRTGRKRGGHSNSSVKNDSTTTKKMTASKETDFLLLKEKEPNDHKNSSREIALPVVIEGTIDRPGDVDNLLSFQVKAGEKLAFELETPNATVPEFNPRLIISERGGKEILSNVYNRVVRQLLSYSKTIEPKTLYTFKKEGKYSLSIRDITQRNGRPDFQYRILIRSQIPHPGKFSFKKNKLNLIQGEAQNLIVTSELEEEFRGEITLRVNGLPSGVKAFPATYYQPEKPPHLDEGPKERYFPETTTTSIIFIADPNSPITIMPRILQIKAQPIVQGKPGPILHVGDLPLMVIEKPLSPH